ncbi:MAG: ester cyclase [Leptospira sp.]|nr:ester cyclase [Leptospira sp.]
MDNDKKIEFILRELIDKNDTSQIPNVFSKEYIVHTSKKDYHGHKIIVKWIKDLNNFFSDLKVVKIQFLVQTNEFIVWKRTIKGKIKPSKNKNLKPGKLIKWEEMIVSKFKEGLIMEEWNNSEFLGSLIYKK